MVCFPRAKSGFLHKKRCSFLIKLHSKKFVITGQFQCENHNTFLLTVVFEVRFNIKCVSVISFEELTSQPRPLRRKRA